MLPFPILNVDKMKSTIFGAVIGTLIFSPIVATTPGITEDPILVAIVLATGAIIGAIFGFSYYFLRTPSAERARSLQTDALAAAIRGKGTAASGAIFLAIGLVFIANGVMADRISITGVIFGLAGLASVTSSLFSKRTVADNQ